MTHVKPMRPHGRAFAFATGALLATTGANAVDAPADVKAFTSHVARKLQQEASNAIVAITNDLTLSFALPGLDEKTQINLDRDLGLLFTQSFRLRPGGGQLRIGDGGRY